MNQPTLLTGAIAPCLTMSNSIEWYTPAMFIEAAREVMGSIDCDPASCELANETVGATVYYTKETNGFTKQWVGNCWVNPPYGKEGSTSNQKRWSARLIEQYQAGIVKQAILLVNSKTGDKWFQPLLDYPICLPRRIDFYTPNGTASGATHSSALVYFGDRVERFRKVFRKFGRVVRAYPDAPTTTLWTLNEGISA